MKVTLADGLRVETVGGALAVFADARPCPAGLDAHALAESAADRLTPLLGRRPPVLYARQEHTRLIFSYGAEGELSPGAHLVGVCDGLITAEPGVVLLVRTADCLPVVLGGGGAAAVLHCGWRGLAADLPAAAVARFRSEHGVGPEELEAVVGAGVGPCHYRVGDEVRHDLGRLETAPAQWRVGDAVDLAAFAAGRLEALGLRRESIRVLPGCTVCSDVHHSHRRDGSVAGRQWSAAFLR